MPVDPSYTVRLGWFATDLDADGHVDADMVPYDNATSGLTATDTQAAIDELAAASPASDLGWFNVKDYGATGDGSTDDTNAINATIAALNTATRGVLYFPAGTYLCSSALTTITAQVLILGDGSASYDNAVRGSEVLCSSQTSVLLTLSGKVGRVEKIGFTNTYAGTPSGGAAVKVTSSYIGQRVDFDDVSVHGFYDNLDIAVGAQWSMVAVNSTGPVRYGLRIRNTVNADAGDWSIVNCAFYGQTYDADAAIRIESSGGGKIANVKVNVGTDSHKFNHGIDLAVASSTVDLQVVNVSIENIRGDGFHATNTASTTWWNILLANVQMQDMGGAPISIVGTAAGDFSYITIVGGSFRKTSGVNAIVLTNVQHVRIAAITHNFTNLTSQTTCTDVVVLDDNTASSVSIDDGTTTVDPATSITFAGAGGATVAVTDDGGGAATVTVTAPAAASGGEILISDTPSTPLIFADLIQNEAQDDLVYAD